MRNQVWLERLLEQLWQQHFRDVERKTPIEVRYGKRARTRLGSLSFDSKRKVAVLRLTRLFEDEAIPEVVVKATMIHELCHYAHGFHSGLDRKYDFPHRNGVIRQEFAERGLEDLYLEQKAWLKANWATVITKHFPKVARRYRRLRIRII